jgi:hypothetical protein
MIEQFSNLFAGVVFAAVWLRMKCVAEGQATVKAGASSGILSHVLGFPAGSFMVEGLIEEKN